MRVALVSTLEWHFECVPPFLDALSPDIEVYLQHDKFHWRTLLRQLYPHVRFQTQMPLEARALCQDYDWIVFPTEADELAWDLAEIAPEKMIVLQHLLTTRYTNVSRCLTTRPTPEKSMEIFHLVTDKLVRDEAHKDFIYARPPFAREPGTLYIALVGSALGFDYDVVTRLGRSQKITFVMIGPAAGLVCEVARLNYAAPSSEKLYWLVAASDYVLLNKVHTYYTNDVLSGSVALAYNALTPLIVPEVLHQAYDLSDDFVYTDDQLPVLAPNGCLATKALYESRRQMLFDNRRTLARWIPSGVVDACSINILEWRNDLLAPSNDAVQRAKEWKRVRPKATVKLWTRSDLQASSELEAREWLATQGSIVDVVDSEPRIASRSSRIEAMTLTTHDDVIFQGVVLGVLFMIFACLLFRILHTSTSSFSTEKLIVPIHAVERKQD
jgi:hypothetical protein